MSKLSRRRWIIKTTYVLIRKHKYKRNDARKVAEALADTYYDGEYYEPENAILEDFSYA